MGNELLDNDEDIRTQSQNISNKNKKENNLKSKNGLKKLKVQELNEDFSFSKSRKPSTGKHDVQTSPVVFNKYGVEQAQLFSKNECVVCEKKKTCVNCSNNSNKTIDFPQPCIIVYSNFRSL